MKKVLTFPSSSLIKFFLFQVHDLLSFTFLFRYGDDVFDRIWLPDSFKYWEPISSSYGSNTLSNNEYRPPVSVMSTAAIPVDVSEPLMFYWETDYPSQQFYIYMHFAEVQDLNQGDCREFSISLNGALWSGPIIPLNMTPTTLSKFSISAPGYLNFSIYKTNRSTLPPILNALEIYFVKQFLQSLTSDNEGMLFLLYHDTENQIALHKFNRD